MPSKRRKKPREIAMLIKGIYTAILITLTSMFVFFSGYTVYLFICDKDFTASVVSSFIFVMVTGALTYLFTETVRGEVTQKQSAELDSSIQENEPCIGFYENK